MIAGASVSKAASYCRLWVGQCADLSPFMRQPVETQNPLHGELSHGIVTQEVHQGVQAGRGSTAGSGGIARRGARELEVNPTVLHR